MFTTLQYSPEENEMTCGELTDKLPCVNQPSSHSACFFCRDKKLKCTGQRNGCDRCVKRGIMCHYATTSGDAGVKRRKSHRASSPSSTSSSSDSSKRISSSAKRIASSKQPKNQASDAVTLQTGEVMADPVPSVVAESWYGNLTTSPSAVAERAADILSPAPMPYPDLTFDDIIVDDMLNFPFDTTNFETDLNPLEQKNYWEESRTTLPDFNSITPNDLQKSQDQFLLDSKLSQRWPLDYRIQERCNSPSSSGGPSSGTSPSARTDCESTLMPTCSCRDMALQILEMIQPQRKRKPTNAIIQQLHFAKGIISQCETIMNCATCVRVSGLMVLVGVISENLMDVLEAVTQDWESNRWLADVERDLQQSANARSADTESTKASNYNCIMGDYKVDTAEEFSSLVSCLLLFQVNRLDEILIRLQKNAITADWESHLIFLQPVFHRLKLIKNKL